MVLKFRLAALAGFGVLAGQASSQLYFNDLFHPTMETGRINRIDTNGTGHVQLVNTGPGVRGLDIDFQAGKMYWADVNDLKIRRANLDGTGQEDLIDLPGGKEPAFPSAVAVDSAGGKIYWGDQTLSTLNRANLDGTGQELLLSTPFHRGLAIDGLNGKVYWTDYVVDIVRRSNLDGSVIQNLFVPPFNRNPQGIALDLQVGQIYWGQDIFIEEHDGKIMTMGLDGSNPHDVVTGFGHVTEIVFAPVPEPAAIVIMAGGLLFLAARRRGVRT